MNAPLSMESNTLESAAEEVLAALVTALKKGDAVYLSTVISTWGSSPRAPGSMMMWSEHSGIVGSVSGGCIEEDLIQRFKNREFDANRTHSLVYGENEEDGRAFKLPCGGKLQLLIEVLEPSSLEQWQRLANELRSRQGCLRSVSIESGSWQIQASQPQALFKDEKAIHIYIGPSHKVLIVGANQIASYLSQFCSALNFAVSVCDPGDDIAADFPVSGKHFYRRYPDGLVESQFNDSASAVLAVSHDPRLDDMALLEALPGKAFYVGAMGSVRTSEARRQRLLELGVTEKELQKMHAPIGLDIGSKTPAEIAISIAADLVRVSKQKSVN